MKRWIILGILAAALALTASVASANHSWNGYHWARTSASFNLKLTDSVTSTWDPYLSTASADWSSSDKLDTTIVPGNTDNSTGKRCPAVFGKDRICNSTYGFNGWLGLAQVWVYSDGHIAQGTAKLNDSYFNTSTYNKPEWRRLVMCQEVAHTFGLDHQDIAFNNPNLGSCMDYTSNPLGPPSNEHPNQHDYEQLGIIYSHLDSITTVGQFAGMPAPRSGGDNGDDEDFGSPTGKKDGQGRDIQFVKNLGGGQKLFTWVFWAGHGNPDKP
jgi:hypothetical protein